MSSNDMFTGIIERMADIQAIRPEGSNVHITLTCDFGDEPIQVDQSIAHDGVCLTVTKAAVDAGGQTTYDVTAVQETMEKTQLGSWQPGHKVNIERCLRMGGRLDGHLVQGHVDAVGTVEQIDTRAGSWMIRIAFPEKFAALMVDKGSICVNGVSLTVVEASKNWFTITIIPYTWEHTNFHQFQVGAPVNLEFDILGKYLLRSEALKQGTLT